MRAFAFPPVLVLDFSFPHSRHTLSFILMTNHEMKRKENEIGAFRHFDNCLLEAAFEAAFLW
jgi:hypothetical protein